MKKGLKKYIGMTLIAATIATSSGIFIHNTSKPKKILEVSFDDKMIYSLPQENTELEEVIYEEVFHTVKEGDTLWEIARENNLTVAKLKSLNNLDSDLIKIGQILYLGTIIVDNKVASLKNNIDFTDFKEVTHVVKDNDALVTIANKYGVSKASIQQLNDLNGDIVVLGSKLKIIIPNTNVGNLTDNEIKENIEMTRLNGPLVNLSQENDLPDFFNNTLNSTKWVEKCYKYNLPVELVMAISCHETDLFRHENFLKNNNVAGLKASTSPEAAILPRGDSTFVIYKTKLDSLEDLTYLLRKNYLNDNKNTIELIGKSFCPVEGNLSFAEEKLNKNWIDGVSYYYNELKRSKTLNKAINDTLLKLHGEDCKLQEIQTQERDISYNINKKRKL